jgi:hypothetical protein
MSCHPVCHILLHVTDLTPYSNRDFHHQVLLLSNERNDQVTKSSNALADVVQPARTRRATLAECQARLDELHNGLARLRKENDKSEYLVSHLDLTL